MVIDEITLQNFRSYESYRLKLDPKLTMIVGKNGIGKTNLLEAIYVTLHGTSFRATDTELTRHEAMWWRLAMSLDDSERELRYEADKRPAKQLIDRSTKKRFSYRDRLPVVLFEPHDLLLISGSPARRRDALDHMIGFLSVSYKQSLGRYERALQQRNNLLKQRIDPTALKDQLFVWDVMLAETGQYIIEERTKFFIAINERLPVFYDQIAGSDDRVEIIYQSTLPPEPTSSQIISSLHSRLSVDMSRGTTSTGPHRDDISFLLNGNDAKNTASRGESRSLILSLKLAYAALLHEVYGTEPIVLLDDVFSELDATRQVNLLSLLSDHQTIITDTESVSVDHGKHIVLS